MQNRLHKILKETLGNALFLDVSDIDVDKTFINMGLDSIVGIEWVKMLNKELNLEISSTKIYDYPTIRSLSHFLETQIDNTDVSSGIDNQTTASPVPGPVSFGAGPHSFFPTLQRRLKAGTLHVTVPADQNDKIAIIGMSGRYPQASNLQEYWDNLARGKNSIIEIPSSRWDVDAYYDADPAQKGKMYCKWLGALDDVDLFDPLFFQITPAETESMDPQHRLFLQESYRAFEDAGYCRSTLSDTRCGVYVGIMSSDYSYLLSKNDDSQVNITGNSFAIGAARISYFLNLKGPAIPIDTACSSSLVALHLACQALLNNEIDMALAGGVSLYLIPEGYVGMCQAGMLSPDGQCKAFDDSANGFVPGEGVGALVLKRLKDAQRDNDHVYGVVLASGINQDGKTNGMTAPSVHSQVELERSIYNRYHIDPETITYIETHGTGTKLGDPIELQALSTVFKEKTNKKNYCALGSVKSNIGHASGAAGVASVQKVLLSMQHKTLVPTLNVVRENTIFDFQNSPFYISKEKKNWETGKPDLLRRAGVSAFGFSGTNAHVVIEEYLAPSNSSSDFNGDCIIPLSARTADQLKQKAVDLLHFIEERGQSVRLSDMAYTLQVGRDEMKCRLGFVVSSLDELSGKLRAYIDGSFSIPNEDENEQAAMDRKMGDKNYTELLALWMKGMHVDWNKLYSEEKPCRISLPVYPFLREKFWVNTPTISPRPSVSVVDKMKENRTPEKIEKLYYLPSFQEVGLPDDLPADELLGETWLVINCPDELHASFDEARKTHLKNKTFVWLRLGTAFAETDDHVFTVNPGEERHFQFLMRELASRNKLPDRIVHMVYSVDETREGEPAQNGAQPIFNTIFHLVKALLKVNVHHTIKMLSVFPNNNQIAHPAFSALGGFYNTLLFENPRFWAKTVELRNAGANREVSTRQQIDSILHEFADKNRKHVEILHIVPEDNSSFARNVKEMIPLREKIPATEMPLKQQGVYLISGGLGGLGLIFGEYLAKRYQCRLALLGRSALDGGKKSVISKLKSYGASIVYIQADVSKLGDVEMAVQTAKKHFSRINGVFHFAGSNDDALIINKSIQSTEQVLSPKINGIMNLDVATEKEELDLFVAFSSIAGVMGNVGQCDYAYANHFVNAYVEARNVLERNQKRHGKGISINWPYWEHGGMLLSKEQVEFSKNRLGLFPISTSAGIRFFEEILKSGLSQVVPLYGVRSKITPYITRSLSENAGNKPNLALSDSSTLVERTTLYVQNLIGEEIKLDPHRIDPSEHFESFGIDSIVIGKMNMRLEKELGILPKTLFYEYTSVEELTNYLIKEFQSALIRFFNLRDEDVPLQNCCADTSESVSGANSMDVLEAGDDRIAIIGMHGRYPQSPDLTAYWNNLRQGKDLVGLVPEERWNYEAYYDPDPTKAAEGKIYCKWGGFLDDVDKFDPAFFNISREEASVMDPEERIFLESVWAAMEDAGYTKASLKARHAKNKEANVGVFVGVTTHSYHLLAAGEWDRGATMPGSQPWSIANRVSYHFNFNGPSMPVDTACSSSSVAIHLACESLKKDECDIAIAGGINLYLHPAKYHSFCKRRMLSLDGKCRSYGAGNEGFVPGEGVGSVVLKPLAKAVEDGDHIYGVIAASAYAHSGRSNGYSAPNPNAQSALIDSTLRKHKIDPESISYVEGHGTGTQLGDSLEIVSLTNAFQKKTQKKQFCALGSVKSNIGHPEAASGIAGLTKIILQMKYGLLVPTLHAGVSNPNMALQDTPFYLQHSALPWKRLYNNPRRALLNAMGAGGVNSCIVVEEYLPHESNQEAAGHGMNLLVLSAKKEERLQAYVDKLLFFMGSEKNVNLADICYTLQVGREHMVHRLAFVASDKNELMELLKAWKEKKTSPNIYQGRAEEGSNAAIGENEDPLSRLCQETGNLSGIAQMWVKGKKIDWCRLSLASGKRISLPTYPFARERYWLTDHFIPANGHLQNSFQLHPLVSYNSSTLKKVSFCSLLSEEEFYALDHRVNGERIFPGSGFLEIANVSASLAGEAKVTRLKDVVWIKPLRFGEGARTIQTSLTTKGECVEFQIASCDTEGGQDVHAEGKILFETIKRSHEAIDEIVRVEELKKACGKTGGGKAWYELFKKAGLDYGDTFQTIREVHVHDKYALSRLEISDKLASGFDQFILHPSLIDGALQTVSCLMESAGSSSPSLPFAIDEIEIIRPLTKRCYAHVASADHGDERDEGKIKKFNIQLTNNAGNVLVKIKNFYVRLLAVK